MGSTASLATGVSGAWLPPKLMEGIKPAALALEPSGPAPILAYGFRPYPNHDSLVSSPWRDTILQERRLLMAEHRDAIVRRHLVFGDHYIPARDGNRLFVKSVLPARDSVKAAALVTNATGQNHISAVLMCAILALRYGLASYIVDDRGSGYSGGLPGIDQLSTHVNDFLRVAMGMPALIRTFYGQDLSWASIGFCGGAMVQLASLVEYAGLLAHISGFRGMVPIAPIVALPDHDTGSAIEKITTGFDVAQRIADALMGVEGTEGWRGRFSVFPALVKLFYLTEYGIPRARNRELQMNAHLVAAQILARGLPVLENGLGNLRVRGFGEARDPVSLTAELVRIFGPDNYRAIHIDDKPNSQPRPRHHLAVFDPQYPLAIQALYESLQQIGLPI